jgi:exopolysaccharide biosynthesis WecB/TagA/CpsF family protein
MFLHAKDGTMIKSQIRIDDYDLERITPKLAEFGQAEFGYVVTPNADHLVRMLDEPAMRSACECANFVLLDSRFVAKVTRVLRGMKLPVCTGSDLTARLFDTEVKPEDRLVLIGGSTRQAHQLRTRYGLLRLQHHNPPMGFIHDPAAVEETLCFIEAMSPFRFCLLAVGSPQQELLAQMLQQRGRSRGLALCIGASINFLTGAESRAPKWMQDNGLEWLYRLIQNPRRLAYRYLVRGPRILPMLALANIGFRDLRIAEQKHTSSARTLQAVVADPISAV